LPRLTLNHTSPISASHVELEFRCICSFPRGESC
jgi:hypothetical protein